MQQNASSNAEEQEQEEGEQQPKQNAKPQLYHKANKSA
jgi:hypothetical protein